jgi:hypothetical protein
MGCFIFHELDDAPFLPIGNGRILGQLFVKDSVPYCGKFKITNLDQHDTPPSRVSLLPQIHGQNMPCGPEFVQMQAGYFAGEGEKFLHDQRQCLLNVLRLVNKHSGVLGDILSVLSRQTYDIELFLNAGKVYFRIVIIACHEA